MQKAALSKKIDYILLGSIFTLLTIGVVMVYSASSAFAIVKYQDAFFFFKRQALFAALGLLFIYIISKISPYKFKALSTPILIVCFMLLLIVIIPGVGIVRNGARSWLGIGSFSIQPSEFMKLAMVLYLSKMLSSKTFDISNFKKGFLPSLILLTGAFGIIMLQPDLGTGIVMFGTGIILIFIAGARYKHLLGICGIGLLGFISLILAAPYRVARIVAFLNPWQDPLGAGYQLIQSLYAMGPGGLLGLGLGMSNQKHLYLPEPHTDFIFSIIAEELGFLGAGTVISLFAIFVWRGYRQAAFCQDRYKSLVISGITSMIMLQSIINIGVVSGAFPITGITLPFLSYGGSSLTLILASVGILISFSNEKDV